MYEEVLIGFDAAADASAALLDVSRRRLTLTPTPNPAPTLILAFALTPPLISPSTSP